MARALTEIPDVEPPRSIAARVLAPLALVACGSGAVPARLRHALGRRRRRRDRGPSASGRATSSQRNEPTVEGDTYVVVPGDTFTGIAEKTGIPLAKLERLNPDLDTGTLNAGQQIKLRR